MAFFTKTLTLINFYFAFQVCFLPFYCFSNKILMSALCSALLQINSAPIFFLLFYWINCHLFCYCHQSNKSVQIDQQHSEQSKWWWSIWSLSDGGGFLTPTHRHLFLLLKHTHIRTIKISTNCHQNSSFFWNLKT